MSYFLILNIIYYIFLHQKIDKKINNFFLIFTTSTLILIFISFRYQVGGDWYTYSINYENIKNHIDAYGLYRSLAGFSSKIVILITYFTKNFFIFKESVVLGIIFCIFYCRYLFHTNNFFLSLYITFPVFLMLAGMGYVNQGIAIIICWQIMINYKNTTVSEIIFYVLIASLFHISALFFLVFLLPKISLNLMFKFIYQNISLILLMILTLVFLIYLFGFGYLYVIYVDIDTKLNSYLFHDYYKSYGTIFRLILFVPCLAVLYFFKLTYLKNSENKKMIGIVLISACILILLTYLIRGSLLFAFLDRFLLYFIFLQVIVTNSYYDNYKIKENITIDYLIYFTPLIYLFLWINFSKYSIYWTSYKNILFFID